MANIKVGKSIKKGERRVSTTLMLLVVLLCLLGGMAWMLTKQTSLPDKVATQTILDATTEKPALDLSLLYPHINNGDSRQNIEATAGYPGDCMEKISLTKGVQEVCVWHDSGGSVVIVLLDDRVISKTKVGL